MIPTDTFLVNRFLLLSLAALAGVLLISADLASAGVEPRRPSDCPDGLDCPPSEHASDNAEPPSSVAAGIARTRKMGPDSCAAPFKRAVEPGGEGKPATSKCVLDQDIVLNETLELSSFTTLDCQGHKVSPTRAGTNLSWPDGRSAPEAAIFLDGAKGVNIRNCVIDGFDFGIFAINSKVSADVRSNTVALEALRNRITKNAISSRFEPVSLLAFDNTEVKDNTLTLNNLGGIGIDIRHDSDLNQIISNNITGNLSAAGAVMVPGPAGPSNPIANASTIAAFIGQTSGPDPTLLSAIVGGSLYQMTIANGSEPDESFPEDNLFEGNSIAYPLIRAEGVFFGMSERTSIRNNAINHVTRGIRAGSIFGSGAMGIRQFPGMCSLNAGRLCLGNSDCGIAGFDNTSQGNCTLPPRQNVTWRARNATVEYNVIIDVFDPIGAAVLSNAIGTSGENAVFRGNTIRGAVIGISIVGPYALETTTATRNNISNATVGLFMQKSFNNVASPSFGANISLNDFTNYTIALQTSNDYNLTSELSVDGKGNYWGLSCPGFDPALVRFQNGNVNPFIADSHPYGVPVSGTPESSLPPPCQ